MHQTFFRKFVKCIAELPGIKARFGFQGSDRRSFLTAFDYAVYLIEHRLTFCRRRFFANHGFTSCFLGFGGLSPPREDETLAKAKRVSCETTNI